MVPSLELVSFPLLFVSSFAASREDRHGGLDLSGSASSVGHAAHQHLAAERERRVKTFRSETSRSAVLQLAAQRYGTLWTAVDAPALTGRMRDRSLLAASNASTDTEDCSDAEKGGMVESRALRS